MSEIRTPDVSRRLVAAPTLARILDVDPRTIYRWAADEVIPSVRLRRTVRFDPDEVLAAFKRHGPPIEEDTG